MVPLGGAVGALAETGVRLAVLTAHGAIFKPTQGTESPGVELVLSFLAARAWLKLGRLGLPDADDAAESAERRLHEPILSSVITCDHFAHIVVMTTVVGTIQQGLISAATFAVLEVWLLLLVLSLTFVATIAIRKITTEYIFQLCGMLCHEMVVEALLVVVHRKCFIACAQEASQAVVTLT